MGAVLAAVRERPDDELRRAAGRARFDQLACLLGSGRGQDGRTAAEQASAEAAAAHALDRDDIHWPSLTHPGGIVWPVVRALERERPEQAVLAAAAGYEATARLARALGPEHRRYWHATATAGTVGAAVAAAVLLGLDEAGTADAAGHAASVTGGSIVCILERSGTVEFHRSHAVATGIAAAQAAAAGLGATRRGLEDERGLLAAMGGDAAPLLVAPGRTALEEVSFRLHATNGFAQAAVEAARELAPVADEARVVLELPAGALALTGEASPQTEEEAWWSTPYAVAVTLLGRELEDDSQLHDPTVQALAGRIELVAGDTSRVSVDGREARRAQARPATDDDLVRKWRTLNPSLEPPLELLR